MSRRRDRARRAGEPGAGETPSVPGETRPKNGAGAGAEQARGAAGRLPLQLALLAAAFAIGVGVAELAGAANLGVAFGVGQVVFALVLIVLLSRA